MVRVCHHASVVRYWPLWYGRHVAHAVSLSDMSWVSVGCVCEGDVRCFATGWCH